VIAIDIHTTASKINAKPIPTRKASGEMKRQKGKTEETQLKGENKMRFCAFLWGLGRFYMNDKGEGTAHFIRSSSSSW